MPASDANGRNLLPGRNTERNNITGMSRIETTSVVGWPITSAGLIPMWMVWPVLRFSRIARILSHIGFSPSMKRAVMRGISSITAPTVTPSFSICGMESTTPFHESHLSAPMPQPITSPRNSGSPRRPNFLFIPSASMSSFEKPGILSRTQPTATANGVKLWQNGWGIEIPSMSL